MAINIDELLGKNSPTKGTSPSGVSSSKPIRIDELLTRPEAATPIQEEKKITFASPTANAEDFSLMDSLARGAVNLASTAASGIGATETGVELRDYATKNFPAATPDVLQLETPSDWASYIGERLTENLPNLAATGAGAAAGATIGSAVPVVGTAAGGLLGALGATFLPIYGEARQGIQEKLGRDDALGALPAATINTGLELIPVFRVAKNLGISKVIGSAMKDVAKEAPTVVQTARKAAAEFVKTGAAEGTTEAIQSYNNLLTQKVLANEDLLSLTDADKNELINALAGGFAAGGPIGSASVVGGRLLEPNTPAQEQALADPQTELNNMLADRLKEIDANQAILDQAAAQRDIESPDGSNTDLSELVYKSKIANFQVPGLKMATDPAPAPQGGDITRLGKFNIKAEDADGNVMEVPLSPALLKEGKATPLISPYNTDPIAQEQTNALAETMTDILGKLGIKDMKLVVGDHTALAALGSKENKAVGGMAKLGDGTYFIYTSQKPMKDFIKGNTVKDVPTALQSMTLDTGFHELGHAIFRHSWERAGIKEQKALLQGYKEHIQSVLKGTTKEKVRSSGMMSEIDITSQRPLNEPYMDRIASSTGQQRKYQTSFTEYLADQFARYTTNRIAGKKQDLPEGAKSVFSRAYERLAKYFRIVKKETKTPETFRAFVDNLYLKQEIRTIEEAQAAIKPTPVLNSELNKAGLNEADAAVPNSTGNSATIPAVNAPIYSHSFLGDWAKKLGLKRNERDIRQHEDLSMGFAKIAYILTPIQLAELAQRSGFNNPAEYMDIIRAYANTKMKQVERADTVLKTWKNLGKESANRVSKLLYEISTESDLAGRKLSLAEIEKIAASVKATPEEIAIWRGVDNSFSDILEDIHKGLVYETARTYNEDLAAAKAFRDAWINAESDIEKIQLVEQFTGEPFLNPESDQLGHPLFTELENVNSSIRRMSNRNYFPRSRMGEYVVKVTSTEAGQEWDGTTSTKKGETVGYYAYDSKKERDQALKDMLPDAKAQGVAIVGDKLETEVYSMMGMPQIMIDKISRDLELTDEQRAQVRDISLNLSPGKRFLRHLQKRKGIAGYSLDAMRVYANYMMSASSHLARVEHSRDMIQALNDIDSYIKTKRDTGLGTILDDLTRLRDYYRRHFQYVMRPDNDWANLRAMGFLWYLGFNIKSALVNMTQIPLVTFPVLGAKYGDVAATKTISGAYADITSWLRKGNKLSADENALIDELREAGVIDESMVSELAGLGEADVLKRTIPGLDLSSALNKVSYYGGTMFRMGEKYNRLVTSLSAYRLARAKGVDHAAGVKEARWAVETTQYEYTKWNRPELMRGKKSVIFMFWQYMQHSAFLFAGGQGKQAAMRMWIITALIAGLQGLPFAETLLDILDLSGTYLKKLFGSADPRVDTREWLREVVMEITDQPDKILYGMSSYWGLGPLHLASLFGVPMPNVDIQGSVGLGRMIPWLEPITADANSVDEKVGKVTAAVLGPILGIPFSMYKAVTSDDPNVWKNAEKAMPVFMKNAMQGARWLTEGRETFKGEGTFMDMTNPEERVGAALKMLGFSSTAMGQKYRQIKAVQEATVYYATRRQLLMQDFYYMRTTGDREGLADVRNAIKDFNSVMRATPDLRKMQITGKDLNSSYRQRRVSVKRKEKGIADAKRGRALSERIQKLYPIVGEE